MDNYLVYVSVALATILLPGPGVMLTINNAIQRSLVHTLSGIVGIACAMFMVAALSATSLGVILASSVVAFTVVKIIGAVYLIYLGITMWRKKEQTAQPQHTKDNTVARCFAQGFFVSVSNPKAVVFFMSIFPQFIDLSQAYQPQFVLLATTFSALVIMVHITYALVSSFARSVIASSKGHNLLNKISGGVFVSFGLGLAASSR